MKATKQPTAIANSITLMYKLTTRGLATYNNTLWTPGVWKKTSGEGEMCGPGWLHCYSHPELALLLNSGHAELFRPLLWEIEVAGQHTTDGLKHATTEQRLMRQIPTPPIFEHEAKVFGVLCALKASQEKEELNWQLPNETWATWAENYLSGNLCPPPRVRFYSEIHNILEESYHTNDVIRRCRALFSLISRAFCDQEGLENAWERAKKISESHKVAYPSKLWRFP